MPNAIIWATLLDGNIRNLVQPLKRQEKNASELYVVCWSRLQQMIA